MADLSIAILFILGISAAGFKLKSLTLGGAAAAACTGVSIYAGFGYPGLILLGVFLEAQAYGASTSGIKKRVLKRCFLKETKGMPFKCLQMEVLPHF